MWKRYLVIITLVFITGCAANRQLPDVLHLRLKEDPTTLDPAYIVDVAGGSVAAKLYSGLVRFDENCRIVPDLAESWQISQGRCAYTFKLRRNCGITAGTVKETFTRILSPKTLSPRKWIFDKVKKINVIDTRTLQILLKEPYAPFLSLLTMPNAYIKGTGPYRLSEWEHDEKLVLAPNPSYFGPQPKLKGIEYRIISDDFTADTEFKIGGIDIMQVSPLDWKEFSRQGYNVFSQAGLNTYYIGFNCQRYPFTLVRVRQAFNYAINKNAIIKHILQGQADPAPGPVPSGLLKAGIRPYPYLPNKAKHMLQGIKFSRPLKIYIKSESMGIQIAESIQHYLLSVGVKTEIYPLEWSAFKDAVTSGRPDLFLMSWWADYPNPENFLFPTFYSGNWGTGGNRARFKNIGIDRLIKQVQCKSDTGTYNKLQRLIHCQAPWLFLWHKKSLVAVQPWVRNFKLYPVYNSDKGLDVEKIKGAENRSSPLINSDKNKSRKL